MGLWNGLPPALMLALLITALPAGACLATTDIHYAHVLIATTQS